MLKHDHSDYVTVCCVAAERVWRWALESPQTLMSTLSRPERAPVSQHTSWRTDKFTERPSRGSSWTALSLPCAGCCVPPVGPGSAGPYKWGSLSVYKRSACVEWPRCCLDEGGSAGPRPQIARSRCAEATLTSQWICSQTRPHMLGPLGKNAHRHINILAWIHY